MEGMKIMINVVIAKDKDVIRVFNNGVLLVEEENMELLLALVEDTLKGSKGYQREVLNKIKEKILLEEVA